MVKNPQREVIVPLSDDDCFPNRKSLNIELRATRGSAENMPLLEAGKLDIGMVEGNDGLGLTPECDCQAAFLDRAGDGPALVLISKVSALWGGGIGWPGITKVATFTKKGWISNSENKNTVIYMSGRSESRHVNQTFFMIYPDLRVLSKMR